MQSNTSLQGQWLYLNSALNVRMNDLSTNENYGTMDTVETGLLASYSIFKSL